MKRLSSFFLTFAALFATGHAHAQAVYVNLVKTDPGYHEVQSGSLVVVRNTSQGDVTITIPYQRPIVVPPGQSTFFTVSPNPGGMTTVEGPDGRWGFDVSSSI